KPLIMMAPKSMLRNKLSFSQLEDFTGGRFLPVLPESDASVQPDNVRRLILCSGKVYYDLLAERQQRDIHDIAIVRIERLYPFPYEEVTVQMEKYSAAEEVAWVQEEPKNQGAWIALNSPIRRVLLSNQKIYGITRPASAAPAVGSAKRHKDEQAALLDAALSERQLERE
ncbi:MAG: 2-oxoglutarate dehydrogenase E1 component, partial [Mariprofundus sp.]